MSLRLSSANIINHKYELECLITYVFLHSIPGVLGGIIFIIVLQRVCQQSLDTVCDRIAAQDEASDGTSDSNDEQNQHEAEEGPQHTLAFLRTGGEGGGGWGQSDMCRFANTSSPGVTA